MLAEPASRWADMQELKRRVDDISGEVRILDYLRSNMGLSHTLIKRVKYGGVFLNGTEVHMRATVKCGDEVTVILSKGEKNEIRPLNIPLEILYEDESILAVSKPPEMPTHPSRGNSLPTLAEAVLSYLGEDAVFRAITRLDRDTSGIVIIAKDAFSASRLSADLKAGKFEKKYIAITEGIPKERSGRIDVPIKREAEDSIKRIVSEDGKPAVTLYQVIGEVDGNAILELNLITGRTHQIRVHLSHIGHPLVNDFLYGTRGSGTYMLHCTSLKLPHPITGEELLITSKPPFLK
ncbi:MAG: RluA family pseudouridine synthase [Clostridia bacterium]|nr:RluA family pseudouridine synthase [Clostridia bacterium]